MNNKLNTLISNGTLPSQIERLDKYDFANLFNVINKGEKSYFNLCKNIYFDNVNQMDDQLTTRYTIVENDSWSSISYNFYQTYKLWWLICKFNGITNPFYQLTPGLQIRIPSKQLVQSILQLIKTR